MKRIMIRPLLLTVGLAALVVGAGNVMAQADGGDGGRRGGNFDPAQFQQQMMDRFKERLEMTNDDEWKAKLAKFREARKAKEAALTKAQEDLRKVLTVRQEATAVSMGLLP
jgi:Spy/CpxP family protein refolding chaperone